MTPVLLLSLLLGQDDALARARAAEEARVRLIETISPAVVALFRPEGPGGGSGVIIDTGGYVLTNFHVVGDSRQMRAGLPDGRIVAGKVIGLDPYADLALVRLEGSGPFPHVPVAPADSLRVGDWTMAMGNPFLLATDFRPTVTLGIVSGLHRYLPGQGRQLIYADCVQVDTPINPGNSGGPLFDMEGRVVGINGRISGRDRGRVNVGVGFAISANQIREVLPDLRAGKLVEHGYLEATVRGTEGKVIIDQMYEDSAAAAAGLKLGDEVVRFDGTEVRSQNHFLNLIGVLPQGRTVEIVYRRDGEERTTRAVLARYPSASVEMRREHAPDPRHVAWETERILERYRAATGVRPGRTVIWEGTSGDRKVRFTRVGWTFRSEADDGTKVHTTILDEEGGRTRDGAGGEWIPLSEEKTRRWRRLVGSEEYLSGGDPGEFQSTVFVGGDRIDGVIVQVLENEETGYRFCFDATTDLLRAIFRPGPPGTVYRIIYDDYRRTEAGLLPHRVTTSIGDGSELPVLTIQRYIARGRDF